MKWDEISQAILTDCAQLVKANSIEGNKKDNLTVIYTPASNLKKSGDMAVGQVSFHRNDKVKRVYVEKRENPIVNRLNKTKIEKTVDHEQEKQDRMKAESAQRRVEAAKQKKAEEELSKQREAEKAARSYDLLSPDENNNDKENKVLGLDDDFMWIEHNKPGPI